MEQRCYNDGKVKDLMNANLKPSSLRQAFINHKSSKYNMAFHGKATEKSCQ